MEDALKKLDDTEFSNRMGDKSRIRVERDEVQVTLAAATIEEEEAALLLAKKPLSPQKKPLSIAISIQKPR